MRLIQPRSAPAEKLLPLPANSTTRTRSFSARLFNAAVKSAIRRSSKALCTSGRFMVRVAIPRSSIWIRMAASLMLSSSWLCLYGNHRGQHGCDHLLFPVRNGDHIPGTNRDGAPGFDDPPDPPETFTDGGRHEIDLVLDRQHVEFRRHQGIGCIPAGTVHYRGQNSGMDIAIVLA